MKSKTSKVNYLYIETFYVQLKLSCKCIHNLLIYSFSWISSSSFSSNMSSTPNIQPRHDKLHPGDSGLENISTWQLNFCSKCEALGSQDSHNQINQTEFVGRAFVEHINAFWVRTFQSVQLNKLMLLRLNWFSASSFLKPESVKCAPPISSNVFRLVSFIYLNRLWGKTFYILPIELF